jgi:MFS family permease
MTTTKVSKPRALYVLLLLSLLTAFNFYDRNLLSILVEPLKHEFGFSDGQIGLLSGLAFAVVYSLFSIPIARYADRGHRVRVLGIAALFWSMMTGLCGMAGGFATILAARFGVGVGEAGAAPTTHAIVAETFSPQRRGRAFAVIGVAGAAGVFAALAGGGQIAQHHGWRTAFYVGAIPGLVVAMLFLLTVRMPHSGAKGDVPAGAVSVRDALRELAARRAFVWMCIGMSLAGIGAFGVAAWMPAFFMRRFALTTAQVGASYSAMAGLATIVGIVVGGVIGDWLSKRDGRGPFFMFAASFALTGPILWYSLMADHYSTAVGLVFPMTLIATIWISPSYAAIQALSGARLRSTGAATFMLTQNLIGQGLGPSLVGWLSDWLAPVHGARSLQISLMLVTTTYLVGAICFLIAARTARADIADADAA